MKPRALRIASTAVLVVMLAWITRTSAADPSPPLRVGESPANEATIVSLPDGTLRVFHVLRPQGTEIRSITSTDNGKTWGHDRLDFKLPGVAYYANQILVDQDGEFQAAFHIQGKGDNGYNGRHYDVYHIKTAGGRTMWGKPKRVYEGYVGSMRGFAQLKSGRLVLSCSVAVPSRAKPLEGPLDYGWNDVAVFYSDDKGDTWAQPPKRLSILQDNTRGKTRYGAVEPHVVQLQDGRVWMLIRTKNGHLYESFSPDGAEWADPKPSRFISSDSPATTVRLKDGRLALFLNVCQRWDDPMSYAVGGREVLHAAISADDGKTWQGFREVLYDFQGSAKGDRGTAYPSAVETADGKIALVSGQGEGRKAIVLIDPRWLSETSASSDFASGEWPQWTMHEAKGAEVIDHPDKPGKKCLAIRKTDATGIAGATWNFPSEPTGKLTLRIKPNAPFRGAVVSLTDNYSVMADTRADDNAVYSVQLEPASLAADQWHDLVIDWTRGGDASMTIDGKPVVPLTAKRQPAFGINYVRVRSAATETDPAGFLIESAAATGSCAAADPALPQFKKRPGSATGGAVLDTGAAGAFDEKWVTCPTVLRDRDGYRMWYAAHYNADDGRGGIGLATSMDGVTWTRENAGKPVLPLGPEGAFDHAQVFGPTVLRDGARYLMWYTGDNGVKDASGIYHYQIGVATSDDGITWTRDNNGKPVLTNGPVGSPDEVQAATPCVLRDGAGYRMWYAAWAPKANHQICTARSADGVTWSREMDGTPVEGLNPSIAYGPSVCHVRDKYLMLYMALNASRGLYAAASDDGRHWVMLNDGKPMIAPGHAGNFDEDIVGHACMLVENDVLRAWYTGYQTKPGGIGNWQLRIGLAEAALARQGAP